MTSTRAPQQRLRDLARGSEHVGRAPQPRVPWSVRRVTPSYLVARRIEWAMMLPGNDLSVTEVCFAVGCSSLGIFSTRFTELAGMPPSAYRRKALGDTAVLTPCVARQATRPVRNREAPLDLAGLA